MRQTWTEARMATLENFCPRLRWKSADARAALIIDDSYSNDLWAQNSAFSICKARTRSEKGCGSYLTWLKAFKA